VPVLLVERDGRVGHVVVELAEVDRAAGQHVDVPEPLLPSTVTAAYAWSATATPPSSRLP
jgi:hypothetical protein